MVKKLVSAAIGAGLVLATFAPAAFAANQCANQTTGSSSYNICTRTLTKVKTLTLSNVGSVFHSIVAQSNSGNNTANNNTGNSTNGGGTINSSASGLDNTLSAGLNTANATVNMVDPASDDVGLNDTTGATSNNVVTFTTSKTVTVNTTNNGTVNHTINSTSNSGGNTANNNTLGGFITTGEVTHTNTIMSIVNDLFLKIDM